MKTDILQPGELIHIDFYFINITSIRGFTCVLNIVDARTRNKWEFRSATKRSPLDTIDYFLTQCKREGRNVLHVQIKVANLQNLLKFVTFFYKNINVLYNLLQDIHRGLMAK